MAARGGSAYLRFRVPRVSPALAVAELRVWVERPSRGVRVGSARGGWSEGGITFRSAPRRAGASIDSGPLSSRGWHDLDVTPLVGAGTVTLTLAGGGLRIASREQRAHAPRLVLTTGAPQPAPPIRAAFYYAWYPEAWRQQGLSPFTHYSPSLGFYDSSSPSVIQAHVAAMRYANLDAAIASWWGPGTRSDRRLPRLLAAAGPDFRWAVYDEAEGQGDPSPTAIRRDLLYLRAHAASSPAYLRIDGRFVVFVYGQASDGCGTARRWHEANTVGAYVVLKVFPGYRGCADQPDGWHQYAPAKAQDDQTPYAFSISPGFFKANETSPRLARDPSAWRGAVQALAASGARFELVTTFNEWGEGTAVESAAQWRSPSGYGTYLDALHELLPARAATASPTPPAATATTIVAAGDIACDPGSGDFNGGNGTAANCRQRATSDLVLALHPDAVLTLGDTQYENDTYAKFLASFAPSWGRFKPLIHPTIGNHEYLDPGADGYFRYFGAAAGAPGLGYYSYDLGGWHLISLNSECSHVGGCGTGSAQETWLRSDLAAHRARCVLAYWHEPRFSSGEHGDAQQTATLWNDLAAAHADVVLSGHNHDYERFDPIGATPQSSAGHQSPNLDPAGIREFVVGTGGKNHYGFSAPPLAGEVVRNADTYGVLELTLHANGYDWRFVPEPGKSFTDSGSASCH